jgi:type IV pilus assembly protein PilA
MKKGFTLIELLAVIVILAVIALIATPIILGIIEDTKKQAFEIEAKNVEQAAEYYLLQGLKIDEVPEYEEYYIPVSEFTDYIQNVKDEMLDESVIVKRTSDSINYYYTGRDSNPYISNTTLKQAVEEDTAHIASNIKVNGVTVNKVIGTRTDKRDIKNWVWYSGQLWQVLETNSDYIKMITANSVASIPYGTNNT